MVAIVVVFLVLFFTVLSTGLFYFKLTSTDVEMIDFVEMPGRFECIRHHIISG